MKIEFRLYASLSAYMPETNSTDATIDIEEGTRIKELLDKFNVPADSVKIIFLNGVHAKGNEILQDGDRLGVFPPIAGG